MCGETWLLRTYFSDKSISSIAFLNSLKSMTPSPFVSASAISVYQKSSPSSYPSDFDLKLPHAKVHLSSSASIFPSPFMSRVLKAF